MTHSKKLKKRYPGVCILLVLIFAIVTISSTTVYAQDPFITTWEVTAGDLDITIPTFSGETYNYDVDWGDGNSDTGITGNATHTYAAAGIYTVEITGAFPRIYFWNDGAPSDAEKILTIEQWGDIAWSSMEFAFRGASNLVINSTAPDAPDLSGVTNTRQMFFGAASMNSDINHWDVSNVTNMRSMFQQASVFNQPLDNWDVSNVTTMVQMFSEASAFDQDISGWDVSGVEDMTGMFEVASSFDQDISGWDVSNVQWMDGVFFNASAFNQNLGGWNVTGVTDMTDMLNNSGLSTTNYDNTLTGWAAQAVQNSVPLGASGLEYCAESARQTLTDPPNNWTITGDALASGCGSSNPFVTTWQVTTGDLDITIPTFPGETYNYNVDWGNGSSSSGVTGDAANTYSSSGTYTVEITGDFPRIYFNNAGDKEKIMTVEQWGDIEWTSMENAFYGATNLEINASDAPDLSSVTSMQSMFRNASSVNSDLNHWNVSNVTDMSGLFIGATVFNGDITGWDVSALTNANFMFMGALAFNQDISGWDVGNVTNMSGMFDIATAFNQDIGGWDVSAATDMSHMFRDGNFNRDISGWDVSDVTNMRTMFQNNSSFNQNLGGWNISNVTDMGGMLDNSGLSSENYDNTLIGWAGQSVQSGITLGASGLQYCNAENERQILIDAPNNWTISDDGIASGCPVQRPFITTWKSDNAGTSNNNQITIPAAGSPINYNVYWEDVTNAAVNDTETTVTGDVTITFPAAGTYRVEITGDFPQIQFSGGGDKDKILTIEQWGDIEWASFFQAFDGASNLMINAVDAPDLSGVTSTAQMFRNATSINSDLNHWNVENITDMTTMFGGAGSFNGDISSWNVSNVTSMRFMFQNASYFNQDITGWVVSEVTDMGWMFSGASVFNRDISGWDVSKVSDMQRMFKNATAFNQDIGSWVVSDVLNMHEMFMDATAFNQDLGGWDITNVFSMLDMLNNSALSTANYDNTLIGWAGQTVQDEVDLGAAGLEYCNAGSARQTLIDPPNNWTITGDALAAGCEIPTGSDQRILASNQSTYIFSGGDFGLSDPAYSVKIETLPGNGDLLFNSSPVSAADVILVSDINDDKLTWDQSTNNHGYNYTSFDFRIVDDGSVESTDLYTMSIDLGTATMELTGGEGWRFLTSPAIGETYDDFLDPVWSQGVTGSDNAAASFPNIYRIDQPNYVWEVPGNMSEHIGIGEAFIAFIYSDDNNDGSSDGFPKTLMSGENWIPLDGSYEYTGLDYDTGQGPEGNSHYLIANPHPISLDFCEMYDVSTNLASSVDIWDPTANSGNGDYINLNCAAPENVHIAPFQAFWVRTTAASPELDIPEDAYLESQAAGYFKQPIADFYETELSGRFLITLNLVYQEKTFSNKVIILFSEDASGGLDEWDAPKLSPAGLAERWLSFYSLDDNQKSYVFQNLTQDFGEKKTIPLEIQTTESGRFTLEWSLPDPAIFAGSYFLRDNQAGQVIELHEGSTYSFEITEEQTANVSDDERSAKSFADLGKAAMQPSDSLERSDGSVPRFELLIAASGVDGLKELGAIPEEFTLSQNYPNPFNPTTVISYQLPVASEVRLEVYDMLGRNVATLVHGEVAAGRHTVNFDAGNLSSGIYLYRLKAGNQIMTRKLTVVK